MTTVLLLHNCYSEIGITALYLDTPEGLEDAIQHMKRHVIKCFNETDLLGEIEYTNIKRLQLPVVIKYFVNKDPGGYTVVSFEDLCNEYNDVRDIYEDKAEKWESNERDCNSEISDSE